MPNEREQSAEPVPTVKVVKGETGARRISVTPSRTPEAIGGYRIVCSLGVGGMAQVYLCHAKGIGGFHKLIVVKAPRAEVLGDADTLEMFLNEARIAGRLNHPNVVQTNEVGMSDGLPFIAMEYLEGQSLSALQRKIGLDKLSTDFQLRIIANALAGLHYAHELEDYHGAPLAIVHRDISPQNVFVTYDGQTKLLDFGIAKAASTSNLTREGVIKGKLAYMAPEQGALTTVDRRADIFSIGVMIWEAVTHRRLVAIGSDELAVLHRRVAGADPKAHEVSPDVPPELSEICSRAMALRPADRYQTASELKEAIESYLINSSRPSDTEIGRFVSEAFAEQRVEVRLQIDTQLRQRANPAERFHSQPPHASESSTTAAIIDAVSTSERAAITDSSPRGRSKLMLSALLVLTTAGLGVSLSLNRARGVSADAAPPPVTTTLARAAAQAPPPELSPAPGEPVDDGKPVAVEAGAPQGVAGSATPTPARVVQPARPAPLPLPRVSPAAAAPKATATANMRPIDEKDPYR